MAPPLPSRPLGYRLLGTDHPTIVVELFHDLGCPFSKKMCMTMNADENGVFKRIKADPELSKKVEVIFQNVPQPWHPQSPILHEAMFAVACAVDHDPQKIITYVKANYRNFDKFTDLKTHDLSRTQLHQVCAGVCEEVLGTEVKEKMLKFLDFSHLTEEEPHMGLGPVTQNLKFAIKHHRGRGVHVTPTVFINGLEASDISSGWTSDQWIEKLKSIN